MDIDIYDLLLSENISDVVSNIIKYAGKNTTNDYCCAVLQFIIDLTSKEFTLANEHLEMFMNENSLGEIVHEIFSSDFKSDDTIIRETQTKFFDMFITKTAAKKLFHADLLKLITNFLEMSITHDQIPGDSIFNMNCHLILNNILQPILKITNNEKLHFNEELSNELDRCFDLIVTNIPNALKFKNISTDVARQIVSAVESYPSAFFADDECKILDSYYRMMTIEDNFLQMTAIKSLKKLASAQESIEGEEEAAGDGVQNRLVKFITDETNTREKSVFVVIQELMTRKALRSEIIALLQMLNSFDSDHLILNNNNELKSEIYMNVLTGGTKKLVNQAMELILKLEDDFWTTIINLVPMTEENIDYESFLTSIIDIPGTELTDDKILELFRQTAEDSVKQREVAIIFTKVLKMKPQSVLILDEMLPLCTNEMNFAIILDGFIGGVTSDFRETLVNNLEKVSNIVDTLLKTFETNEDFMFLNSLIFALKKLASTSAEYLQQECRSFLQRTLAEVEENYKQKKCDIKPIKKLIMLMENHTMNLMSQTEIIKLNTILNNCLDNTKNLPDYFTNLKYFIRCYTNFVKCLWTKIILGHSIGISYPVLIDNINAFMAELKQNVNNHDELTLDAASLELTSYLDMLVFFQPSMNRRYPNTIFSRISFNVTKEEVKSLAAILEKLTFEIRNQQHPHEYEIKRFLISKWVFMCQSYEDFPSATASEKFLRHYSKDSEFKPELEKIMLHAMESNEVLEKTAAFAILNLSNQGETRVFKQFISAFDDFLLRVDSNNRPLKIFFIATCIIKKLPIHIKENDGDQRLLILDFIKSIIEGYDIRVMRKLKEFLPKDENVFKFTAKELKQYQSFVEYLDRSNE